MIKWAAAMDWHNTVITRAIEVRETPKTYKVERMVDAVSYRSVIHKDDNILFDTEKEALEALVLKLERRWEMAADKVTKAKAAYTVAANALEELR